MFLNNVQYNADVCECVCVCVMYVLSLIIRLHHHDSNLTFMFDVRVCAVCLYSVYLIFYCILRVS